MKGLSAEDLDNNMQKGGKAEAVAHLREMRDVLTPFIKKFSQLFESESDFRIPDFNKSEHVTKPVYDEIFFKYFDHVAEDDLTQTMFVNLGDQNLYDMLYEKFRVVDSETNEPLKIPEGIPEDVRMALATLEENHKKETLAFLKATNEKFLEDLKSSGLEDYFLKLGKDKRMALWRTNYFIRYNTKGVINKADHKGSVREWTNVGSYEGVVDAKEMVYGFPVGMSPEKNPESPLLLGDTWPVLIIPVGEYGKEFAEKIFVTTQVLFSKVSFLKDEARRMVAAHEKMFKAIARGEHVVETEAEEKHDVAKLDQIKKAEHNYLAGILALEEGIATLAQVIALLSANKIEGFETGETLLRALIEQELPNQAGYRFSPAVIGPLSLSGKTIEEILLYSEGNLTINSKFLDFCKERNLLIKGIKERVTLPASGRGCPVSFTGKDIETSGINMLSQIFLKVFEQPR